MMAQEGMAPGRPFELDELDRRIIELLRRDGRRSCTSMAEAIGTGKHNVQRRLNQLRESGAITITAQVDPVALGIPLFCNLGVQVRPGARPSVASTLAAMEEVAFVAHTTGTFDLLVEAFLSDTDAVFEFLNQRLSTVDGIVGTKAWLVLRSAKYAYLWEEPTEPHHDSPVEGTRARGWTTKPGSALRLAKLDDVDRQVIRLLREDGRRQYTDIADRVGVTQTTVAKRVDRLLAAGVLLIVAHVNWLVVGFPVYVTVSIKASRGRVVDVGTRLAALTAVDYVGFTTGDFDIVAEAFLRDTSSLLEFLNVDVAAIPGVDATETWHVLRVEKLNYMWEGESVGGRTLT
jgi:DNA-binding Lrp family transcriptional regulator